MQRCGQINRQFTVLSADQAAPEPRSTPAPPWDWSTANRRKIDAVRQAAPLTAILDDLEVRIAALMRRTAEVELG